MNKSWNPATMLPAEDDLGILQSASSSLPAYVLHPRSGQLTVHLLKFLKERIWGVEFSMD